MLIHRPNAAESESELERRSWRCWTFSRVENLFHMPARVSGPEASSRPAEPHVRWIAKVLWCPGEATSASPRFIIRLNAAQLAGMGRKCVQAPCDGQQPVRLWPLWLEKKNVRLHYVLTVLSRWNRWPGILSQNKVLSWLKVKFGVMGDLCVFCTCVCVQCRFELRTEPSNTTCFFKKRVLGRLHNPGSCTDKQQRRITDKSKWLEADRSLSENYRVQKTHPLSVERFNRRE